MTASSRTRGPIVLAVWLAVTASAVAVVWFGMDSVVNAQAGTSPELLTPIGPTGAAGAILPVDPLGLGAGRPSAAPSPSAAPPIQGQPSAPGSPSGSQSGSQPSSPPGRTVGPPSPPPVHSSPATASDLHRYSMAGGVVVAQIDGDQATLVSATPNPGYQMADWVQPELIRVDFTNTSNNALVYEVFIAWNGYSPQVTEVGPDS